MELQINVVMLLYPNMTQLDLTGPYEVLVQFKELSLHLVAKNRESDHRFRRLAADADG